jgi:hypothetical protein
LKYVNWRTLAVGFCGVNARGGCAGDWSSAGPFGRTICVTIDDSVWPGKTSGVLETHSLSDGYPCAENGRKPAA